MELLIELLMYSLLVLISLKDSTSVRKNWSDQV